MEVDCRGRGRGERRSIGRTVGEEQEGGVKREIKRGEGGANGKGER